MKNTVCFSFLLLFAGTFVLPFLSGCSKSNATYTVTYSMSVPIYVPKASLLANINGDPSTPLDSVGRVYVKDQYIYLNESNKGIHVYDNSNPSHPVQVAWLAIPGNQNIAIKGNTLYADMYEDLLAIDISDLHQVKVTGTVVNLFPSRGYENSTSEMVIGYTQRDTTITMTVQPGAWVNNRPGAQPIMYNPGNMFFDALSSGAPVPASNASNSSGSGTAGSTAGMVLINNYIYAIAEGHSMGIVDLTNPSSPTLIQTMQAGFDLETIYPFGNELFLGSAEGVYMFDISNPTQPVNKGVFTHGRACDPVISDGTFAYVTLHAGTSCGGSANELDIVSLKNLQELPTVYTYPMTKPTGLSKDGNLLFICDDFAGIKIFDATDPSKLQLLSATGTGMSSYDVIALNGLMIVVADKGLFQYDYTAPAQPKLLSTIKAVKS